MILSISSSSRGAGANQLSPAQGNQFSTSLTIPLTIEGSIPQTRLEGGSTPRYMWEASSSNADGDSRAQTLSIDMSENIFGDSCFKTIVTESADDAGSMFTWYFTNIGTSANNIQYMREFLETEEFGNNQTWPALDTINRLRFWYQPTSEMDIADPIGNTNFHVGVDLRATDSNGLSQESDNWHFYHYYNIPYLGGNWAQMIVDNHPSHQRSASGTTEHGAKGPSNLDPTNSPGYGYFDLMTNFYVTERYPHDAYPTTSYVDGFEVYADPNGDEDIDHIYALWGGIDATTNEIVVGWKRDKTEDDKTFEVK